MGQKRSQRGNQKFIEKNENGNTMYKYLWDVANTIFGGKFRGINICIKKNKDIKYTAQLYISRN